MSVKIITLSILAVLHSAAMHAEISANIGLTSNYLSLGVSQTNNQPAVSGGVDYAHDSGLYVGTWISTVDFDDASGSQIEWDIYAGYSAEVGDFGYDLGAAYYAYPKAQAGFDELDFSELYANLSYRFITVGAYYTVDKEDRSADKNDLYLYVSAGVDLSDGWSLLGTLGHYDYDAAGNYQHAQLDLSKSVADLGDFTLSISKLDNNGTTNEEDPLVFASWVKSF